MHERIASSASLSTTLSDTYTIVHAVSGNNIDSDNRTVIAERVFVSVIVLSFHFPIVNLALIAPITHSCVPADRRFILVSDTGPTLQVLLRSDYRSWLGQKIVQLPMVNLGFNTDSSSMDRVGPSNPLGETDSVREE
jgi:hypothetical protein